MENQFKIGQVVRCWLGPRPIKEFCKISNKPGIWEDGVTLECITGYGEVHVRLTEIRSLSKEEIGD